MAFMWNVSNQSGMIEVPQGFGHEIRNYSRDHEPSDSTIPKSMSRSQVQSCYLLIEVFLMRSLIPLVQGFLRAELPLHSQGRSCTISELQTSNAASRIGGPTPYSIAMTNSFSGFCMSVDTLAIRRMSLRPTSSPASGASLMMRMGIIDGVSSRGYKDSIRWSSSSTRSYRWLWP